MKTTVGKVFVGAMLAFSISGMAMEINQYHSGSWWNASQSGHGFSIEVIDKNTMVVYWYAYNPDRTSTFILAVAQIEGNTASGTAYYYSGMKFGEFNPNDVDEQVWGTITLTFQSCDSATLEYSSTASYGSVPFESGQIELTRLLGIDNLQCSDSPYAGLYQGNLFSVSGLVNSMTAILAPNGDFVVISHPNIVLGYGAMAGFGSWSVHNGNIALSGIGISLNPFDHQMGNLFSNGVIQADYRMSGTYSIVDGDHGWVEFYATPSFYRRGVTNAQIAGTYLASTLVSGVEASIHVADSGSFSGQASSGNCTYSGQFQITDERFNIISANVTLTGADCGIANGDYNGYAVADDMPGFGIQKRIMLAATNGTFAELFEMWK